MNDDALTNALRLLPIAKAMVHQAQTDAPNYRPASAHARCATCTHFDGQWCDRYDFTADADYICDGYDERNPAQEMRALVEKLGARNSRTDLGRIQQVHDLCVELGATCEGEVKKKNT